MSEIDRKEFLKRSTALLAGASLTGSAGLLAACRDSTGPTFDVLPLSVTIAGLVEVRSESEDNISGKVHYTATGVNADQPVYAWTVRDKLTNEILATKQGDPVLHHEFTGRGTQVVDVTMRETDGRTASTRFETQFLGPRKPYDLIAVVRSDPGETYGFLNFLDPEFLGSMRQEVMQEDNNLRDITFPLVYVGSGVNQAPDGEYVLLVMDRDHINVGLHRVVHEYNRRTKWLDPLGSSSCENIYPVWTTNPGNLILTYATNRRLLDTEEFEVRFDRPSPDWLQLIWAGDYLSDHSGVHVGPHRDFFGKHSAIHPDGFTIAFGPTPFDDNAGEVRRVALYHLTERTRRRFPEENALGDFLSSHFPAVDPTAVRVGENGMAFAPDGQRMAVTLYVEPLQKNILAMADLSGGDIQLFAGDGRMPSFSPDGNRIGYLNSENHLLIASVGSGASSAIDATVASGGQGKHDTAFAWTG